MSWRPRRVRRWTRQREAVRRTKGRSFELPLTSDKKLPNTPKAGKHRPCRPTRRHWVVYGAKDPIRSSQIPRDPTLEVVGTPGHAWGSNVAAARELSLVGQASAPMLKTLAFSMASARVSVSMSRQRIKVSMSRLRRVRTCDCVRGEV